MSKKQKFSSQSHNLSSYASRSKRVKLPKAEKPEQKSENDHQDNTHSLNDQVPRLRKGRQVWVTADFPAPFLNEIRSETISEIGVCLTPSTELPLVQSTSLKYMIGMTAEHASADPIHEKIQINFPQRNPHLPKNPFQLFRMNDKHSFKFPIIIKSERSSTVVCLNLQIYEASQKDTWNMIMSGQQRVFLMCEKTPEKEIAVILNELGTKATTSTTSTPSTPSMPMVPLTPVEFGQDESVSVDETSDSDVQRETLRTFISFLKQHPDVVSLPEYQYLRCMVIDPSREPDVGTLYLNNDYE